MKTKIFQFNLGTLVLLVSVLFAACSGSSKKETEADEKFGRLQIEIPESLKEKTEVVNYINDMNKLADDYALLIDRVADEAKEFRGKNMEELGIMDKIKLTKIAAETSFQSIEILGKWGEYVDKRMNLQEKLTQDEVVALEAVYDRFEERLKQVQARHAELFNEAHTENADI
ncbi:MAG: hypothetical protein JXP36_02090 [Bacteroidales bacterium]|nr:hypothetical protein [Bacteroidales bacterium]